MVLSLQDDEDKLVMQQPWRQIFVANGSHTVFPTCHDHAMNLKGRDLVVGLSSGDGMPPSPSLQTMILSGYSDIASSFASQQQYFLPQADLAISIWTLRQNCKSHSKMTGRFWPLPEPDCRPLNSLGWSCNFPSDYFITCSWLYTQQPLFLLL